MPNPLDSDLHVRIPVGKRKLIERHANGMNLDVSTFIRWALHQTFLELAIKGRGGMGR